MTNFMTYKGMQSLDNPDPETVAHSLCNQLRFNGLGDRDISIGHHSFHCLQLARIWRPLDVELHKLVLFHDFPEFFTGDITTYAKNTLGESFKKTIHKLEDQILYSMGVNIASWNRRKGHVKIVDYNALTLEAQYCFNGFDPKDWPPLTIYDDTDIIRDIANYDLFGMKRVLLNEIDYYGAFGKTHITRGEGFSGKESKRLQEGVSGLSRNPRADQAASAA